MVPCTAKTHEQATSTTVPTYITFELHFSTIHHGTWRRANQTTKIGQRRRATSSCSNAASSPHKAQRSSVVFTCTHEAFHRQVRWKSSNQIYGSHWSELGALRSTATEVTCLRAKSADHLAFCQMYSTETTSAGEASYDERWGNCHRPTSSSFDRSNVVAWTKDKDYSRLITT
jgi:hypothetical protein